MKEIWREGLKSAPRGILREIDASIYQVWVMAQHSAIRAARHFEESGSAPVLTGPNGKLYQNPYLSIIRQENLVMMRAAAEMGFTPTARMRVKDDGEDNSEEANPFDQFSESPSTKPN